MLQPSKRQVFRVLGSDVAKDLPKRPLTAHKYSVGKIFVLAGSRGLTGAPYMTSLAAMRSGAGGVILGVPKSIYPPLVRKLTEVMLTPLEETAEGSVSLASLEAINEKIEWSDVVVIGPGISHNAETRRLLLHLIPAIKRPLVLDADGLNCIAADTSVLRRRKASTILTPHVGELSRLIGRGGKEIELNRVTVASQAADRLKSIVVLKGSPTVTGLPSGPAYVNSTGNPGMATAGTGDVLTGIIAGLLGQGMQAERAAYSGVFIHGLAGDIAARKFGERSVMALDILERIPDAIKSLEV
jgi:NAD(P)H-hydrate epimerase